MEEVINNQERSAEELNEILQGLNGLADISGVNLTNVNTNDAVIIPDQSEQSNRNWLDVQTRTDTNGDIVLESTSPSAVVNGEEYDVDYEEASENVAESEVDPNLIPENSQTHLQNDYRLRFSGAIWAEKMKQQEITLAGVGGIGSWLGLLFARFGVGRLNIFDDDRVDATNMSGQLYPTSSIGEYKTSALSQLMITFANFHSIYSYTDRFTTRNNPSKIMICGFDNMAARRLFYTSWKAYIESCKTRLIDFNPKEYLFMDGRLAAEELQIFAFRGDDEYYMKEYEDKYLFSDEEAEPTVCSYKQTSFMANMIAGLMSNIFANFVTNQCEVPLERDIPFLTSYQADYMIFKTVN